MPIDWTHALVGGIFIGFAVSLMLLGSGRVTGISGIVNGALSPVKGDTLWRVLFVVGLFVGGLVMKSFDANVFENEVKSASWTTVMAGLLVGFGTVMGSGCTSGHGICGISRLSPRSLVATAAFIAAGIAAVAAFKGWGVIA